MRVKAEVQIWLTFLNVDWIVNIDIADYYVNELVVFT